MIVRCPGVIARITIPILTVLMALLVPLGLASATTMTWTLAEYQPNVAEGGRGNTIAVHPTNNNVMLVASQSGGLFRTVDGGSTWNHVDSFIPYALGAVVYLPANPDIVIATANRDHDDFAVANGGGIWRSTNGGSDWIQIPHPPAPTGSTVRFSAGEISIAPDTGAIYVATSYGISISVDQGATWTTSNPFGSRRVSSVLALSRNRVLAGHDYNWLGIRRSLDGGASWGPSITGAGGISDLHAFGRSPLAADQAYVVNSATQLFVTEDAGATWTHIPSAPAGSSLCGGISFAKATASRWFSPTAGFRERLHLHFGNRCGLYLLTPPKIAGTNRYDYSGAWTPAAMDHGDTRDLAFTTATWRSGASPLLLTTDGGLHKTADGGLSWSFTGGGASGYNALQITEVKGQWINDLGRYDLYFGTQDNHNRASADAGATWPGLVCCEGFFFQLEKEVATAADTQVNFVSCSGCTNLFSDAIFSGLRAWPNPPGVLAGNPAIIARSFHVQGVDTDGGLTKGFAVTRDLGATWRQYVTVPEDRRDMPRLSRLRSRFDVPTQYQSIHTGWDATRDFEINHLVRLTKNIRADTASAYYPAMNGFGGLGINPTEFAWYQVFGVDPADSRYLIAPDIVNEKMMQSTDGGENWTDMPALTALVTGGGRYRFRSSMFPFASAVNYYAADPNMVGVGTHDNGIMLSSNHGATWQKVAGSEQATYITSIEWSSATEAYVSTYGRGLWRLQGQFWIPELRPLCRWVDCLIRYIDRGDPPPDYGVVVFEGRIRGIRAVRGQVEEIFVSPGSSIGFLAQPPHAPKVQVTPSQKWVGLQGDIPGFPNWTPSDITFAVILDKTHRFLGMATATQELPTRAVTGTKQREPRALREDPRRTSPTATRPYISLMTPSGRFDAMAPGDAIVITGLRFPAGIAMEILLDGQPIGKASADANGGLHFQLKAPAKFGLHRLTVRDPRSQQVIDGTMFIVTHGDEKKGRQGRLDRD